MKIKEYDNNNLNDFKIQNRSFIVWANHPSAHAECTPGYTKLLLDLGYNVDIVMINNEIQEDALCLMKNEKSVNIHTFSNTEQLMKSLLKESKEASGLMITTGGLFYPNDEIAQKTKKETKPHVKKILELLKLPKFSILMNMANNFKKNVFIFHKTWQLDNMIRPILGERMVHNSALLFKSKIMPEIPMINPNYFGKIEENTKNKITTFVIIGEIRKDKRNYEDLIESTIKLHNKGYEFTVNIIGKGDIENLPKNIQSKFNIMGYLEFNKMYDTIQKSDFIIPLLSSNIVEQRVYADEKTSGAIQLIYGFKKPAIIEKFFASTPGFNNKNAIIYEKEELFAGMKNAIEMPENIYKKLQKELSNLSTKIYQESIKNLEKIIDQN